MFGLFLLLFQQSYQIDPWFSAIWIIVLTHLTWSSDIFIWLFALPLIFIIAEILSFLFFVCHNVADLHWRWSAVLDKFLLHTFVLLVHNNIFQLIRKLHLLSKPFVCLVLVKCLEPVWLQEELLLFGATGWLRRRRKHFWENTWEKYNENIPLRIAGAYMGIVWGSSINCDILYQSLAKVKKITRSLALESTGIVFSLI